jgi:hypothetical protein
MKIYHRLLLQALFYYKITGKSRFERKAAWVSVVAGYGNTMYIFQITV